MRTDNSVISVIYNSGSGNMFCPALLFLGILCSVANAYNILAFFPLALGSHIKPFQPLLYELARRGHNVTELSSFPPPEGLDNYKYIPVPHLFSNTNTVQWRNKSYPTLIKMYHSLCLQEAEKVLRHPDIQTFIQTDQSHFDAIIIEGSFCSESFIALGHKYGAPVINFQPLGYWPTNYFLFGNLLSPASVPDHRLHTGTQMDFLARLDSLWFTLADFFLTFTSYYPKQELLMDKYFKYKGSNTRHSMKEMLRNISMTFVEHDIAIGVPQPLPPNIVFTGGMHIKSAKPLPPDLDKYISEAPDGVIFFSFGTNVKFANMPPYVLKAFLDAFGKIKQKILWKTDVDVEVPPNVLVRKWFPQTDILGHKNCRLFITHGGIHSAMEAGYHGVPVVMMPGFWDQFQNVLLMQEKGLGKVIGMDSVNADIIVEAVEEVLGDETYAANAKRVSSIMRSSPMSSLEKGVYWTEYVILHNGAHFLKPASTRLSLVQFLCLDILLVVVFVLVAILFLLVKSVNKLCCRTRRKDKTE
uniref:2-hydroxyacylsphingosine 1-beta-galactosyltransferase n=1 Tax=Cacopsylla melanoneura TaxID=428564 RepID=A0A8D8XWG3_9HEMI